MGVAGAASTLVARGPLAIVEFCWDGAVAAWSIAAAWALVTRAIAGVPLTRSALLLGLARDLQVLCWTTLPSNIIPGTRTTIAAVTVAGYIVLWLATSAIERRSLDADRRSLVTRDRASTTGH